MNSYVDLATVKNKGNLDITTTDYDTLLLFWAEAVSRYIDEHTHRFFYCSETARYFNGSGATLNLPIDLLSVSSFKLDQDGSQHYSTSLVPADYVLNPTWTYPKTYIKHSLVTSQGSFASNIPAGVLITGVWGYGTGETATPYIDSGVTVNTTGITNIATTHALASGKGVYFSVGMTIRITTGTASEQLYITGVSSDTLTFQRGVNGTTAAAHISGDTIYIYQYHSSVVAAALVQLSIWWKRRESAYAAKIGNTITGEFESYKGLDPAVKDMLETGRVIRRPF
jgi:hypothetical protein